MTIFPCHSVESAPAAARRSLAGIADDLGFVPSGAGLMANSPRLLDGFVRLNMLFEACSLDPLSREVLVLTVATRNGCHLCIAMHSARLTKSGADPGLIAALRSAAPLDDRRLEAIRVFTLRVLETAGDVGDDALSSFLAHGYTAQNALDVVLGIGTYTLSTFANRLTGAPVDPQYSAFAWEGFAN